MKNSKEYAGKIHKLHRELKRKQGKVTKATYEEPVEALVYGIISKTTTQKAAKAALKRFDDYFIDLNDLRVSTVEEIIENLAEEKPQSRIIAENLIHFLRYVFKQYNVVSLKSLQKMGKRPARSVLERIPQLSQFAIDYCMLTSLNAHAIPLTDNMMLYLKDNELVHQDADQHEIEGFLMKQIAAKDAYEFYALLRKESESTQKRKKSKSKTTKRRKTKTKRKTKKKKTTKRKRTRKKG